MVDLGRAFNICDMDLDDDEADERASDNIVEFPCEKAAPHSNLDAALRLAKAGISIFPCRNSPDDSANDKKPIGVFSWTKESTTDEKTIRAWFRKHPGALIGIDCGKSGLVVVDPDRHGSVDGVAAFGDLVDANGDIPIGPVTFTAGDGEHYYFRQPDEPLGNTEGSLPDGINVRGAGGYVIAQGSMRADGVCGWKPSGSTCPGLAEAYAAGTIPVIPQWLAEIIRAPKQHDDEREPASAPLESRQTPAAAGQRAASSSTASDARGRALADKALAKHVTDLSSLGRGSRNNELNNAGLDMGHMVARGWIGEQEVRAALEGAMLANGYVKDKGIGAVRKTLNSSIGKGKTEPHKDLPDREDDDEVELLAIGRRLIAGNEARDADGRKLARSPDGTIYDTDTGEIVEEKQPAQKPVTLNIINAASLAGISVPERRWLVKDMIPESKVTLLYGDGGSGKSLLAIQLACAVATGGDWIGESVERGRALYLSCEDEIDEHHRRLDAINSDIGLLGNLDIIDMAGEDAVLSAPMGRGGMMKATAVFDVLRAEIVKRRPSLLVLDNLADVFGGDEINKLNVRQFCTMLNKLARELQMTILMLAHPSVSGMATGSGTSGNVAWSNSVRSRLYLERKITREGQNTGEDDPDIRILTTKKSNGAAVGNQVIIRWEDWMFVREEGVATNAKEIIQEAEHIFMKLLRKFEREGRTVSAKATSAASYAPKLFAEHHDSGGIGSKFFVRAMNRLFDDGKIKVGMTEGPPSKRREIIVEANADDYANLSSFGDSVDD